MVMSKLTHQAPGGVYPFRIFILLILLFTSTFSRAQTTCDPAAEFSYDAGSYCGNGADPVLTHATGTAGNFSFTVLTGGPNLSINSLTGAIDLAASDAGQYTVTNTVTTGGGGGSAASLVLTGVVDGPLTGGIPKAVELYAINDIPDLENYSLSNFNNGSTSPTSTFTFPAGSLAAGTHIWVASEPNSFTTYFGFAPNYITSTVNVNGDDAFRLFYNGAAIDVFGEVGVDGTGTPWDYLDGWAYRVSNTGPDGNVFQLGSWTFSGINALDGTTTNGTAGTPWPIGTYSFGGSSVSCSVSIEIVAPPLADAGESTLVCEGSPIILSASGTGGVWSGGSGSFSDINLPNAVYTPAPAEYGTSVSLTWTVSSTGGICTSATDEVQLTLLSASDAEFSYGDSLYCPSASAFSPLHSTGTDGIYSYVAVAGGPNLQLDPESGTVDPSQSDLGTYAVTNTVSGCGNMVITGVVDGPITGGLPKAISFYTLADIPDLSAYGFGSANNGGGSDGEEYTFPPVAVPQGTHLWVATESNAFEAFFGFAPDFTDNFAPSINGDDAIELFCHGMVIDVFGDINVDGTGTPWDYLDGWAYRKDDTGPDGPFFRLEDWTFSGANALDFVNTNSSAPNPMPANTFTSQAGPYCADDSHTLVITIEDNEAPLLDCPSDIQVNLAPGACEAVVNFQVSATDNCAASPSVQQTDLGGLSNGSSFPIGQYTLTFESADPTGNTSTCSFDVTIIEYANPTPTLTCNDFVSASLDAAGQAHIGADMVLEGGPYGCYDHYQVDVLTGTGLSLGDVLGCNHIGTVYTVMVTDPDTGNKCWGTIQVEDKLPPVITCQDLTISCTVQVDQVPAPVVSDNCDANPLLNMTELLLIDNDACDDDQVQYRRSWVAADDYGNLAVPCQQVITIERPAAVDFPEDITWHCSQYGDYPGIITATALHPGVIDQDAGTAGIQVSASLSGSVLGATGSGMPSNIQGEFCQYNYSHSDEVLSVCGSQDGVFKVVRTWTVFDWCAGQVVTTGVGGEDNVQLIKVLDAEGPSISLPTDLTVAVNMPAAHPQLCGTTGPIPMASVSDNCSGVAAMHIFTPLGEAVNGMVPAPGLSIGNHTITYTAVDHCGNFTSVSATLTVVDQTAPVAVCDDITDVNLSSDGLAEVYAYTFDDGSHDNCCLDHYEVRRMADPCDDGHNDLTFGPSVRFCCADVDAGAQEVVFRAYDCFGNYNECMVTVLVQDKQVPTLVSCPANQRITCDEFADLWETQLSALTTAAERSQLFDAAFGAAEFQDNCTAVLNRTFSSNIDQCLEGTITRGWTATDAAGNTSVSCSQTLFIDHVSDWTVSFPADLSVNCGTTVPDFGEPAIFSETCELVGVSYHDQVYTVVPDACYKIERTWTLINWCVVGSEIDQEVVESSERAFQLAFPQEPCDFDGDGDCDTRTFRDSWRVAPKSKPTAGQATTATGPDTDPDSDPWDGYITYKQVIKVNDTVDPVFSAGCDIPDVCVTEAVCYTTLTLPVPVVDECSPNVTVTVSLDYNGTLLTGFGPISGVAPGTYTVTYNAMDNCNNQSACVGTVTVKDCKNPTVQCVTDTLDYVEIHITDEVGTPFGPELFVYAAQDNCSAPEDIRLSFSPHPADTVLVAKCEKTAANEVIPGLNNINVYAIDEAGNATICATAVEVVAVGDVCDEPLVVTGGTITNENDHALTGVHVSLGGTVSASTTTQSGGTYQFNGLVYGGDYTVVPSKDDVPLNGVTTFDLVLISKHILGTQPLATPYKLIAADANNSKTITTFDLVELRKLILFMYDHLPNNTSWRFVRKGFVFPNPTNPWQTTFPELVNMNDLAGSQLDMNFIGVKVGDVNGSAAPGLTGSADERTGQSPVRIPGADATIRKGERFTLPLDIMESRLAGMQFTLDFDASALRLEGVTPGIIGQEHIYTGLSDIGAVTVSWNTVDGQPAQLAGSLFQVEFTARKDLQLREAVQIGSRFTVAEAYREDLTVHPVVLDFGSPEEGSFRVYQNMPNPFGLETVIGLDLPVAGTVHLQLTDLAGRVVASRSYDLASGHQQITLDRSSLPLAPGVYYYTVRLEEGDSVTRKLVVGQ